LRLCGAICTDTGEKESPHATIKTYRWPAQIVSVPSRFVL
jgi:hypothetical protein